MNRKACIIGFAGLVTLGCAGENPVEIPEPNVQPPSVPSNDLFVTLRLPDGRRLVELDTVTVTAIVTNIAGTEVGDVPVEWSGDAITPTGPRSALVRLSTTITQVNAVARSTRLPSAYASIVIRAEPYPGSVLIWKPGASVDAVIHPPAGASRVEPSAINNSGEVVGTIVYPGAGGTRAFYWSASTGLQLIAGSLGSSTRGVAINDAGVVAGTVYGGNISWPFTWTVAGGMVAIQDHSPGGSQIAAISNSGRLAGTRNSTAFTWTSGSGFFHPWSASARETFGIDINDRALLTSGTPRHDAGVDYNWLDNFYFSVWVGESAVDVACDDCVPAAMNDGLEVVGIRTGRYRAFKWSAETGFISLPQGDALRSMAYSINKSGAIAGFVEYSGGYPTRAVVWSSSGLLVIPDGTFVPGASGSRSTVALDINDAGTVLVLAR